MYTIRTGNEGLLKTEVRVGGGLIPIQLDPDMDTTQWQVYQGDEPASKRFRMGVDAKPLVEMRKAIQGLIGADEPQRRAVAVPDSPEPVPAVTQPPPIPTSPVPNPEGLEAVTVEILILKKQTAANIVDIGLRLIKAKTMVGHGHWLSYLKERVKFSDQTARNFMRVARKFGSNSKALLDLEPTKVYELLEIPDDERADFMEQHNLEAMTTRQTEDAVTEWKAKAQVADEARKAAEKMAQDEAEARTRAELDVQEARAENEALRKRPVIKETVEVKVYEAPPEMQRELEDLRRAMADKDRSLQQQQTDLAKVKKWHDDVVKDLQKLRDQVDKDYTLDAKILDKEAKAKELDQLVQQMQSAFEDGKRNRRGGPHLMRVLFPLDRVIWTIARDVHDLRQEGVGGPCQEDELIKLRTKLRELANDLDAILKDRKTIVLTADMEVLKDE